jgi:hypothetical protein
MHATCFSKRSIDDCDTVLTYNDVIVKNVKINCDSPELMRLQLQI